MRAKRILRISAFAVVVLLYPGKSGACDCSQPGDFRLWYVDSTTVEIAVAWQPVAGASGYSLERSTACDFSNATAYSISPTITAYGDTGQQPDDRCRFAPGNPGYNCWQAPVLSAATAYTYRVRAASSSGERISNCITAQLATGPTRGVAGDLWADVVLGQPDFAQNALMKTDARSVERPSGIAFERGVTGRRLRVYVADVNRNRVLGFDHLGTCNGAPCTSDADCGGGTCVLEYPNLLPSVMLGQDGFTDKSACNGDGTGQYFPARAPASATSLCLVDPFQISITETSTGSWMDTDDSGALYVPDVFNHRILRYADPFVSQVADTVLGQDDFSGNNCNKGRTPDCTSLCLEMQAGVAIDVAGSVWVADTQNARVLRFPKCPASGGPPACTGVAAGHISPEADVVLGQPDCWSNQGTDVGRGLNQFWRPADVAFDRSSRTLYVTDLGNSSPSRILKFHPPAGGDFTTGMAGTELPVQLPRSYPGTAPQLCDPTPFEITVDTQSRGLWVRGGLAGCADLVDVNPDGESYGDASHTVYWVDQWGQWGPIYGIAPDPSGNLFITDLWYGVLRRQRQATGMGQPENVFGTPAWSADSFGSATGVAVLSDPAGIGPDQLIVGDIFRLLIWNTRDPATLRSGQGADDVYGAADFDDGSNFNQHGFYYPQVSRGRLWIEKTRGWSWAELEGFDYPLCGAKWQHTGMGCTQLSAPSQSIPLTPTDTFTGYPLLGYPAAKVVASPPDAGDADFAFTPAGDAVWIADRSNSRVFRIANLDGSGSPYVDVILGQRNGRAKACNRRGGPRANTLCLPYSVNIDAAGNLFVGDNGGESGTNQRVLEFDAASLVTNRKARFGVPATRVYGTGGDFTIGWGASILSPFKPILDPRGRMVVSNNAYTAQRFPVAYLDPLRETLPQLILGDMTSYPQYSGFIDRHGNLYVPDKDWSRVLIYKTPFARLSDCGNGVLDPGEECDDGNTDPSDGCTNACTICGDGVVSPGEQCDDGNLVNGDGCANDCTYELIPGNGAGSQVSNKHACFLEWAVASPGAPQAIDRNGRPSATQSCKDNDPSCDFDSAPGTCEFHVIACLNNIDPNLPACQRLGVARVYVQGPRMLRDPTNYTSLVTALADLRDPLTGATGITLPLSASQTGFCTAPFPVRVRLGGRTGSLPGLVRFSALAITSTSSRRAPRSIDKVTLVCTP